MSKVLVIVPAYNEEESIYDVVKEIQKKAPMVDIAVINDGSKDNTKFEAQRAGAIVLDLPNNLGIGGAVQTGYLYAYKNDYDIAFQIDGDGQHDPGYINGIVEKMEKEKCDMIIGSRFIEKTGYKQTFLRMLGGKILSFEIKLFTGKKIYDPTSGYRATNKDIIKKFAHNYPYDYPEPDTTMQVLLEKRKVVEVPVEMRKREKGTSFVSPMKSVNYMVKVSLALFIARIRKK